MFYKQTKIYYVQVSKNSNSGGGSSYFNPFIDEGKKLLDLYAHQCIAEYITEVDTTFENLKKTYPQYPYDAGAKIIVDFVDALYNTLLVNEQLDDEIIVLQKELAEKCSHNQITVREVKTLEQSTSIKMVYLQYMLLFDLSLTNGVFVDKYLEEARIILEKNGGVLYHPDKGNDNCNCDC